MRSKRLFSGFWMGAALLVLNLAVCASARSERSATDSYEWRGQFVAFDDVAKMITVKSPAVGEALLAQLPTFKAGDKIVLKWSGFDNYASAIIGASPFKAGQSAEARFAFPVEFVSVDTVLGYVTFKAPIPVESVERVKSLRHGEWITGVSVHGAGSYTQPIAMVRGFNDPLPHS